MPLVDTAPEARRVGLNVYRSMTPAERVATAVRLSEDARAVALAGIARRQPHLSEPELAQELLRLLQRSLRGT